VFDEPPPSDTRFALPACDDPPSTEIGVIVMGLPAEQLLAGLGMAALADDPVAVILLMDQVRHGGGVEITLEHLVAAGLDRWRSVQPELAAAGTPDPRSASLRYAWAQAYGAVDRCGTGARGPAATVYLAACSLRDSEIEKYARTASETSVLPQVPRSTRPAVTAQVPR
jgi:Family of unknown function (DUF6187)